MQQIQIGADPEVFFVKDGKIVPSIGLLPGTKEHPHRTEHGWVQVDNVLAEFNIPPASDVQEFLAGIRGTMADLEEFNQIVVQSSHEFQLDELRQFGSAAFEFGCDPDFNAWRGGAVNPRPNPRRVRGLRTAGGHIHIGAQVAIDRPLDVIRGMDVLLGLPSVYFDEDTRRRTVYGKAGAFRNKKYGVEYRTLSNFWLLTDDLIRWAYEQSIRVTQELDVLAPFCAKRHTEIERAINTSNQRLARDLLEEYAWDKEAA